MREGRALSRALYPAPPPFIPQSSSSSSTMTAAPAVDAAAGFHLVGVCVAVSLACELILWGWAYSKPEFRALRVSI